MYTVVILLGLIWIAGKLSVINLIVWLGLIAVFIVKLNYEEKLLSSKFSGYKNYLSTSKKLIPFIY